MLKFSFTRSNSFRHWDSGILDADLSTPIRLWFQYFDWRESVLSGQSSSRRWTNASRSTTRPPTRSRTWGTRWPDSPGRPQCCWAVRGASVYSSGGRDGPDHSTWTNSRGQSRSRLSTVRSLRQATWLKGTDIARLCEYVIHVSANHFNISSCEIKNSLIKGNKEFS